MAGNGRGLTRADLYDAINAASASLSKDIAAVNVQIALRHDGMEKLFNEKFNGVKILMDSHNTRIETLEGGHKFNTKLLAGFTGLGIVVGFVLNLVSIASGIVHLKP